MKKIYRTIWNPLLQRLVVTYEASSRIRHASAITIVGTLLALDAPVALADNVIGTSAYQGGFTSTNSFTTDGSDNLNQGNTWVSAGTGTAVNLVTTDSGTPVGGGSTQLASFSAATTTIKSTTTTISSSDDNLMIKADGTTGIMTVTAGGKGLTVNSGADVTTLSGGTNNIVGTTNNVGVASGSTNNIGTGGANNNIGSSASTNTIQGTTTVTGATTVTGTANINTAGTANTSIGNNTGTVALVGSTVSVGTNSASVINVGSTSGNSTLNFNNNRLQNVGNAVAGTDAVNLNQLNSAVNGINSAINGIQNQVNTNKAGIAGVTAATNLPGLVAGQKYNFGVAWGNYQAYNGIAIGGHARVSENITLKVSGSATSGTYSGGAGMSIGF